MPPDRTPSSSNVQGLSFAILLRLMPAITWISVAVLQITGTDYL
jgi:hypothetical protein